MQQHGNQFLSFSSLSSSSSYEFPVEGAVWRRRDLHF